MFFKLRAVESGDVNLVSQPCGGRSRSWCSSSPSCSARRWRFERMPLDIFPNLNLPVIYVAQPYGGMDPAQMEGLLTNYYEYHFLYITGIHHVESRNDPGHGPDEAASSTPAPTWPRRWPRRSATSTASRAFMPPGTVSPFIMRFDAGSVPVGYLVLSSETKTHRRDPGPGAVQGPADVREPARRLGPAAVRRQPAHRRRPRRPRPAPLVQHVARRGRRRPRRGQHDQPLGQRPDRRRDADRAGQLAGQATSRSWRRSRSAPARTRRSTSATSATVAGRRPTSPPATRWSTAGGPSTSW